MEKEGWQLFTYLDEGFSGPWGVMQRRLKEDHLIQDGAAGALHFAWTPENLLDPIGAGWFSVRIGEQTFTCLRVFQLEGELTDRRAPFTENYVTKGGRTVYRCNWRHPENDSITVDKRDRRIVDGVTFVRWYDCLATAALDTCENE